MNHALARPATDYDNWKRVFFEKRKIFVIVLQLRENNRIDLFIFKNALQNLVFFALGHANKNAVTVIRRPPNDSRKTLMKKHHLQGSRLKRKHCRDIQSFLSRKSLRHKIRLKTVHFCKILNALLRLRADSSRIRKRARNRAFWKTEFLSNVIHCEIWILQILTHIYIVQPIAQIVKWFF